MEREIVKSLIDWKEQPRRKPLVLQGVRQCGKTYALCEFGKHYFKKTAYFNFEKNSQLIDIFDYDYDCGRILRELAIVSRISSIDINDTLIIFDEIQDCPKAITSLKYFCEDYPQMYLVAAGSLLGPAISHNKISFPVGKVDFLMMYPMSFYEFLLANGYKNEIDLISQYDLTRSIPESLSDRLKDILRIYYVVGGMPEAVAKWIETHDMSVVDKTLDDILIGYANDFGKYLDPLEALRVAWIWDSVPVQLAKENNKFVFSHVKQGKRAAELEDALQWLNKAGLIYKLSLVPAPQLPLSFYEDATYFKVYMCDVGLLRRKSGLSDQTILEETPLFKTFKGAFTENFVMCELLKMGYKPYFWRSGNSAEVDFMLQNNESIVPLESKAEISTKAKSLKIFCNRYKPQMAIKFSMKNIGDNLLDDTMIYSVPLYLSWRLPSYLKSNLR